MLDSRIKLRHLQAFLEVAKRQSFARAADSLAVTQPAMSKTIRELEEAVAAALFERGPRGVTLTPAGLALMRHAGPALNALQEGLAAVRQPATGAALVRLGALSTVEEGLLPQALERLHAESQEIRLQVLTGPSAYLLSQLSLGELDLVVGRMSEAREIRGLSFEHLYHEPLVLVARAGHPLAARTPLDAEALGQYPWVVPPAPTTLREQVERFWVEQGGPPPPITLETLSLALSRRYVQRTSALWVAPLDAVRGDLDEGSLVRLTVDLEAHGGSVGLCVNATRALSPAAERLCAQLRSLASERESLT
ncbi:LysR family transcriptional regulator, pca operon transcriptional activator [Modicisalibacter muralis]|uniref:LysR family transcriptional regulator, pca operon transcriptional activator n=1 Tax=Modicisalibacter muralis TaxID=119000 RepID=A0A1G9JRF4_9GAMM|nr:pca operon transcription factor PcaQ [Halomonas muralis]SDL39724.1 LysR family transcriptional regulator, pca operon transcriptional activator [Halomonas muralis]